MSRLCYGLVIVLLCCGGQQSRASECQCKCPPRENTTLCVDLRQLNRLVRNISLERNTSDNSRFLLPLKSFDEIRKDPQLHGCVVTRILDFYQSLFKHRLGSAAKHDHLTNFLLSIKRCIRPFRRKKKVCDALRSASMNESFTQNLSDLSARKLSLLQIHTLDTATQQKVSNKVRFSGSPVFSVKLLQDREREVGDKKVLMGGVLKVYEKLIEQMLAQSAGGQSRAGDSPRGSAQEHTADEGLRYVLGEVKGLQEHKYHESTDLNEQLLNLQNIKTNNTVIQNKALREFPWLYHKASSLVQPRPPQARRRRQALRTKTLKLK